MIYVYNGDIGQVGTSTASDAAPSGLPPRTRAPATTLTAASTLSPLYAIYQDTAQREPRRRASPWRPTATSGSRAHLNYRDRAPRRRWRSSASRSPGDRHGHERGRPDGRPERARGRVVGDAVGVGPASRRVVRLSSALTGDLADPRHGVRREPQQPGRAERPVQLRRPERLVSRNLARPGRRRPEDHGDLRVAGDRTPATRETGCTTSASGTARSRRRPSPASRTSPRRRRSASTATAGALVSSSRRQ